MNRGHIHEQQDLSIPLIGLDSRRYRKRNVICVGMAVLMESKRSAMRKLITLSLCDSRNYKQLLDEVFAISRIIKVEGVNCRSRRLRLITFTETLIILDITKTESNNCFIIH